MPISFLSVLIAAQPNPEGGSFKNLGTFGGTGLGPFGDISWTKDLAGSKFSAGFSAIVGLFTLIAVLWFIFQLVTGALQWIGSGGEKAGLEQARNKITNGIIGLIIVVAAIAIVSVIGTFLGFDILNIKSFMDSIKFQ